MKELALPFESGSHAFDLSHFAGNKFIFFVQLKVIDTRNCERDSDPIRGNCTIGMPCDCEYMKDFPEFLFVSHYEENVATISWRPLSNESWQQIISAHSVELQMAIYSETTAALLCTATTNPMTTSSYTFLLDDFTPHPSAGILLTTTFADSNHCTSRTSKYKLHHHSSKSILVSDQNEFFHVTV
ncbi:enoyl-CoA hydratase/isomerase [Anopheles sinensis]|uniref:Enoyl-CoA hydratase/isomerase n=1 Tax=Anopheles sinensis TaxID=74873 RepID=A0A084VPY7_ANOSI|nr:enoyl-CoA hydratase/isomerase [Anopheles sinensis]